MADPDEYDVAPGLLRASLATLDRPYVEHWATVLGVRKLLQRALDQA